MRRRLRFWIVAAVVLLAAGALLSGLADERKPPPQRQVRFPRWMRLEEKKRADARRTLAPVASVSLPAPAAEGGAVPERRDPFLVALPRDSRTGVVVLEANALRHSRIGKLYVDCVVRGSGGDPFEAMRDEAGIDPLKDVDRVAFAGDGFVVSGFFERARFDALEREAPMERYGDHGRVYSVATSGAPSSLGMWRDQLIVFGPSAFVRETLDRIEGRLPYDPVPVIAEELTFGEAYGVVPGSALRQLFSGTQGDLGRRLAEVAQRIELHADAMRDVALVARVTGADAAQLDDLATAFGAALSVGRLDAQVRGADEVAEVLEHARVQRGQGGFSLELALPIEVVERWFEGCGASAAAAEPGR
jgi:hypothetical protein